MTNRFTKAVFLFIVGVITITGMVGCSQSIPATTMDATTTTAPTTKTVTDMTGKELTIPVNVERVACLVGPSYDMTFMLDSASKIAIGGTTNAWGLVLNPAAADITKIANSSSPNVEELIAQDVQVVFFWNYPDPTKAMTDAGLAVVATLASQSYPETADSWVKSIKDAVHLYASVLGDEAMAEADAYCAYFDGTVERITSVTSTIPKDEKVNVYYIRGQSNNPLNVNGKYSNTQWFIDLARGSCATQEILGEKGDVTLEQVISWNPEVIFMGTIATTSPVVDNPDWSGIEAVKTNKVYLSPQGEFKWDYGVECPLLLMYIAKTLYPDKFQDIDMVKEVKHFYSTFFEYTLTDDQANRILNHQDPE